MDSVVAVAEIVAVVVDSVVVVAVTVVVVAVVAVDSVVVVVVAVVRSTGLGIFAHLPVVHAGGARGGRPGLGGARGGAKVIIEPHRHEGVFIARGKEDLLVSKNLVPGESVYNGSAFPSR